MKLVNIITESFHNVSINGILYSLSNDEKDIYSKIKANEEHKLFKSDLDEFMARVANNMVTKGILQRRRNPDKGIYFVTKGRRKSEVIKQPLDEVAPPDKDIEKWIGDNKQRFEDKYGKDYKKYLYGKAWNKFNSKKITEGIVRTQKEIGNTGLKFDDYSIDFEVGMEFVDDKNMHWKIIDIKSPYCYVENENGQGARILIEDLDYMITTVEKYYLVYDPNFFNEDDLKDR